MKPTKLLNVTTGLNHYAGLGQDRFDRIRATGDPAGFREEPGSGLQTVRQPHAGIPVRRVPVPAHFESDRSAFYRHYRLAFDYHQRDKMPPPSRRLRRRSEMTRPKRFGNWRDVYAGSGSDWALPR